MSAWTVIDHEEVPSGGVATIVFANIPQTYTDLVIVASLRSTRSGQTLDTFTVKINADTNGYSERLLRGDGSSADSFSSTVGRSGYISAASATSNTFGNLMIYFPNYAATVAKSWSTDSVSETNATGGYQAIFANLQSTTDAITDLTLDADNGDFVQYSSATLYGVTKGSSGGVTVS